MCSFDCRPAHGQWWIAPRRRRPPTTQSRTAGLWIWGTSCNVASMGECSRVRGEMRRDSEYARWLSVGAAAGGSWRTRARSKTHRKLLKARRGGLRGRRRPRACPTPDGTSWRVSFQLSAFSGQLLAFLAALVEFRREVVDRARGLGGLQVLQKGLPIGIAAFLAQFELALQQLDLHLKADDAADQAVGGQVQ